MRLKFPTALFITGTILCLSACRSLTNDAVSALLAKPVDFDTVINGKRVSLFTLRNENGIAVQLTNYGGYLVTVIAPDKNRKYADVLLGYKNISSYLKDKIKSGCIIGPNAHIIAGGKFTIDGVPYQLQVSGRGNNSHSSPLGFDREVFDAVQSGNKVTLTLNAPDMRNGFPGNRKVTAVYELLPDDTHSLEMTMTTDKKTIANLTNHAYFNLAGEGSGDILGHFLQVFADSITPYFPDYIPTGEIMAVEGTPFDLRHPVPVRSVVNSDNEMIRTGKGLDHNFVLSKKKDETGIAVYLFEPSSGRSLKIFTNQPGIQIYTGNYLDGTLTGISGKQYFYRSGIAMEPQKFPDAPNHSNFPSSILDSGQVYNHIIRYVFGIRN